MSRHGLNINAQRVPDKLALMRALERLQPAALVVMDGLGLAKEIKAAFPTCKVIHRAYGESGVHTQLSPRAAAERWARENYGDIYTYGTNEFVASGDWSWKRFATWLTENMDEQKRLGVRGVVGNWPPGAIPEDAVPRGDFDDYLRAEDRHKGWHIRGTHDYTGFLLPFGGGWGGKTPEMLFDKSAVQEVNWPTAAQVAADWHASYHLQRDRYFDERKRQLNLDPNTERILTEFGKDRMPDWEQRPQGNIYLRGASRWGTCGYELLKGIHTYCAYIAEMFPLLSFEQVLAREAAWAERVYPAWYLAFCWFTWSPNSADWDKLWGFDMSKLNTFYTLVQQSGGGTVANLPKPTGTPVHARLKTLPTGATYRNIRGTLTEEGLAGADVGDLIVGDEVFYFPAASATFNYHYVRQVKTNIEGWVLAAPSVTFEVIVDEPADCTELETQIGVLNAQIAGLQATNTALSDMNTTLQADKLALQLQVDNFRLLLSGIKGLAQDIHEQAGHLYNTIDGGLESVDKAQET